MHQDDNFQRKVCEEPIGLDVTMKKLDRITMDPEVMGGKPMKQLSHLLMTVILVASCGYASRASAIEAPTGLVVVGDEIAAPNLGDLLVHVVSPITSTQILPSTYPLPGQKSLSLHVTACRGEFEPTSFVLRAQSHDMTGVTLTATDLRSVNSSAVISSTHVDIKIVKPWFQSYYAWNEIGKSDPADFRQRLVPELLLKDDALVSVDISAERNFVRLEHGYEWINQKKLAASDASASDNAGVSRQGRQDIAAFCPASEYK